jgi:1,4-dihydroxy-2-naphthoyl-CoA hydrolase
MAFVYHRTVHFSDTDAAGVVFFANYLAICHEAYEESLAAAGLDLKTFFSEHAVAVPIAHSRAEYLRPLGCGDKVRVTLTPAQLDDSSFALDCELHRLGRPEKLAARVRTEHVCIASQTRERCALPAPLAAWIKLHSA